MSHDEIVEIKEIHKQWEEKNKGKFSSERKKEFVSTDGIPIKRVYTPADLKEKNMVLFHLSVCPRLIDQSDLSN